MWARYLSTSRTGGQPSWRRRLGWRKGSLHGSTGRRQPECCPLHRGDVDSLELDGPLACSLIRANLNWRAGLSVCHRLVTGAVDTRRRAPRCALPWEYEAPDSRRSESSRQLRRCPVFRQESGIRNSRRDSTQEWGMPAQVQELQVPGTPEGVPWLGYLPVHCPSLGSTSVPLNK